MRKFVREVVVLGNFRYAGLITVLHFPFIFIHFSGSRSFFQEFMGMVQPFFIYFFSVIITIGIIIFAGIIFLLVHKLYGTHAILLRVKKLNRSFSTFIEHFGWLMMIFRCLLLCQRVKGSQIQV